MATDNIVPRADGEGSIGTSSKAWNNGYFKNLNINGGGVAPLASPAFTGNPTTPTPNLSDDSQKIVNSEWVTDKLDEELVPVDIDSSSASGDYYSYPVPTGKVFANFKTLGGKTVAWNQLAPNGNFVDSSGGWISNGNSSSLSIANNVATITFNTGSPVQYDPALKFPTLPHTGGHKYLVSFYVNITKQSRLYCRAAGYVEEQYESSSISANTWTHVSYILTGKGGNSYNIYVGYQDIASVSVGDKLNFRTILFIDLTLMFGAGNEPTVAEFESMFPANYYAYNEGTLVSAGIKEVIAKDSSNNVVATMPIPSAVQSLEGYGWSAGSVYNYIDFARKKFVKCVGSVDLGTLSWTKASYYFAPSESLSDAKNAPSNAVPFNGTSSVYTGISSNAFGTENSDLVIALTPNTHKLNVIDSRYSSGEDLKTALSGKMLYYELATPQEIDISSILGAVGIACGNTLTFNYDTNYRLPVPVSMDLLDGTNGLMTPQDKAKLDVAYGALSAVSNASFEKVKINRNHTFTTNDWEETGTLYIPANCAVMLNYDEVFGSGRPTGAAISTGNVANARAVTENQSTNDSAVNFVYYFKSATTLHFYGRHAGTGDRNNPNEISGVIIHFIV